MGRALRLAVVVLLAACAGAGGSVACSSFGSDTPSGTAGADADPASEASSGVEGGAADANPDADAAPPPPFCTLAPVGSFCEDFEAPLSGQRWRLTQCTVDAGYHCTMGIEGPIGQAASRHLVMTTTDQPGAEIDALVPLSLGAGVVRFAFRTRVVSASVSVLAASLQLVAPDGAKTYLNFRADGSTWLATWEDNALARRGSTNAVTLATGWHSVVMELTLPTGGACSTTNAVAAISVDGLPPVALNLCVPAATQSAVVQVGTIVTALPTPAAVLQFDDLLFTTFATP
jgi:hypothetical protein